MAGDIDNHQDLPDMLNRTMVLMSLSKTFAWTGCRAGYIIGGPELMSYVFKVPVGICGVPVPFQKAAVTALNHGRGVHPRDEE